MTDIDVLESVLRKDVELLENVRVDQYGDPTPCPEMDVRTLMNHVAGFALKFAADVNGRTPVVDPDAYQTQDPAGDFRRAADDIVQGWRSAGDGNDMLLSVVLMEYVTHGCDLALATGQPVPFTDEELTVALDRARRTLPADRRGPATIGTEVPVPGDAPVLDRLLGFMGRRPTTSASIPSQRR